MINRPISTKRNVFKADQIIYDKDQLIDCSNKSPMWMHSVDRKDTDSRRNMALSFLIMIGFLLFVCCLFYYVGQRQNGLQKKPIVKLYTNP